MTQVFDSVNIYIRVRLAPQRSPILMLSQFTPYFGLKWMYAKFFQNRKKSNTAAGPLKIPKLSKNVQNLQLLTCKSFNFHPISFLYDIKNVHNGIEDICEFQRFILIFMAVRAISVFSKISVSPIYVNIFKFSKWSDLKKLHANLFIVPHWSNVIIGTFL